MARFIVPGIPVGFKTTTKRAKWSKTYGKYVAYKDLVQWHARAAGIRLPLVATKDRPLMIRTIAYFKDGNHPDPGNVQKGVCDALFYDIDKMSEKKTRKGDDKYTGGSFPPPRYDKKNPRVVVIIEDYVPKKRKKDGKEQKEGRREEQRAEGSAKTKRAKTLKERKRNLEEGEKNVQTRRTRR
jgi:hypothetical protein